MNIKIVVIKVGALILGLFYASIALFVTLTFGWLIRGNKLFHVKERKVPPRCLSNPKYGRHRFVQLEGIKMHYVENGDSKKPLMLFLHGWPEFWFSWRHQMTEFTSDYWCVAPDLRGYGDTDKPLGRDAYDLKYLEKDVCDLVKALKKTTCTLVAHDWGGIVAWCVAAHNQNLIDKLIILNAPHPLTTRYKMRTSLDQFFKSWYVCFFQVPLIPEFCVPMNDFELYSWIFVDENKKSFVTEEDLEAFKYVFSQKGDLTGGMNYYRQNVHQFLIKVKGVNYPMIKIPTLFIWGEDDIALSRDYPELTKKHVTDLTIKYIPKGNHYIQQDKPQIVNSLIKQYLNIK